MTDRERTLPASIVVVGAGGFGRGAVDVIDEMNAHHPTWAFVGFLDDVPGSEVLGPTSQLVTLDVSAYVIAIADPETRQRLDTEDLDAASLVAPSSVIGRRSAPGPGSIIRSNCSVASDVVFGRHVHVNMNVTLGHDVVLGDYVTVHPGANVGGETVIKASATVSAGATVLPRLVVGEGAIVGAGSVVLDDVPAGATVVGTPARVIRTRDGAARRPPSPIA